MKQDVVTLIIWLVSVYIWLVSVYAAICAAAYFGNRVFMYFPDPTRVAPVELALMASRKSSSRLPMTSH